MLKSAPAHGDAALALALLPLHSHLFSCKSGIIRAMGDDRANSHTLYA